MPDWLMWIVYILIVIVMISVLVAVHEAGHLAMAKLFRVYCFEYSIGMGPKIFSKRKEGKETTFSLRAVPFGGYVSMYGETDAVPEGFEAPDPSRSLNNIAKWKKALILVAGVTMNFVLGLTLIYIGDQFCPTYYSNIRSRSDSYRFLDTSYDEGVLFYIDGNRVVPAGEDEKQGYLAKDYKVSFGIYEALYPAVSPDPISCGVLATHVRLYETATSPEPLPTEYVAVYRPKDLRVRQSLSDCISLYPVATGATVPESLTRLGFDQVPQLYEGDSDKDNAYDYSKAKDGSYFTLPLQLAPTGTAKKEESKEANANRYRDTIVKCDAANLFRLTASGGKFQSVGINVEVNMEWLSFPKAWQKWGGDVQNACGAVVKGFAMLFTKNGFSKMSGIVGITTFMPEVASAGGVQMVLYFAGMISINLAFFNLLPFPGLDGWQLLVTGIEAATKKKVPVKVQSFMSAIGLLLLVGLMIAITVKDIIGIFIK